MALADLLSDDDLAAAGAHFGDLDHAEASLATPILAEELARSEVAGDSKEAAVARYRARVIADGTTFPTLSARLAAGERLDADTRAREEVARVLGALETWHPEDDSASSSQVVDPPSRVGWWAPLALAEFGTAAEVDEAIEALVTARRMLSRASTSQVLFYLRGPHVTGSEIAGLTAALNRTGQVLARMRAAVDAAEGELGAHGWRWRHDEAVAASVAHRPRRMLRDDVERLMARWPEEIYSRNPATVALLRLALEPYHPLLTDEALSDALNEGLRSARDKARGKGGERPPPPSGVKPINSP